jgi:hypothetical protein
MKYLAVNGFSENSEQFEEFVRLIRQVSIPKKIPIQK